MTETARDKLGRLLNTVKAVPYPCPQCRSLQPMEVRLHGVYRRCCGHVTELPPLHGGHAPAVPCKRCLYDSGELAELPRRWQEPKLHRKRVPTAKRPGSRKRKIA